MAKFIIVDKKPERLEKNEMVIEMPNFVDEILEVESTLSKSQIRRSAIFFLKSVAAAIGRKYDPEQFNPYTTFPYSAYEGIEYHNAEDLSAKIVIPMFVKYCPTMFDKYIETKIKARPATVQTVYFVGPEDKAAIFIRLSLDRGELESKRLKKEKKISE